LALDVQLVRDVGADRERGAVRREDLLDGGVRCGLAV
jgi:hypothetical protein